RLKKKWSAPVYAFYKPDIKILTNEKGQIVHEFSCANPGCTQKIKRNTQTNDKTSTKNLHRHAKSCWKDAAWKAGTGAGSADKARPGLEAFGRTGKLTTAFKRAGKGKVTYSIVQHTSMETSDRAFQCLMKTGRPEYKIPSPSTVSRDIRHVFAKCRQRIGRMLQEYEGELNFTFDAWTSPNHRPFIAFAVHLHHRGAPLSMILDVIEVAESHSGFVMAAVFDAMLKDFGIQDKVSSASP
ncbi:uncharacterized protein BXZ73DRAFT_54326, partial [Epithele typhae]|uniref:uncharacterized protein n=1 Tax=Epithele typhae TaxID=378194 RepID=UPI00200754C0